MPNIKDMIEQKCLEYIIGHLFCKLAESFFVAYFLLYELIIVGKTFIHETFYPIFNGICLYIVIIEILKNFIVNL